MAFLCKRCLHYHISLNFDVGALLGLAKRLNLPDEYLLDSSQLHLTAGGIPGTVNMLNDIRSGLRLLIKFVKGFDKYPDRIW